MIEFVSYKAEHLHKLVLQNAQLYMGTYIDDDRYAKALEGPESWTGIVDGKIIGSAGFVKIWDDRAMTWALLSSDAGDHFLSIHRYVKERLEKCIHRRIEATVDCEFPDGHRWVEMLGFTLEAPCMKAYRPDGGNCSLYAKVRS